MENEKLRRYAELLAKRGIGVKKGQEIWVDCAIDQPAFIAMVVEELYKAGAGKVVVDWTSDEVSRLHYTYRSLETLSKVDSIALSRYEFAVENLPARLHIISSDPDAMAGIDQEKVSKASQATYPIIRPYIKKLENKYQWCIAAVPGRAWAKKVFPDLEPDAAVEKLWEVILSCSRADNDDPVAAWDYHNADLAQRCAYLNSKKLRTLRYHSANGTDLTVGLMAESRFAGGNEESLIGDVFNPNIPSEEVFTSPKRGVAEGIVYATKPLSYRGELIENFSLRFEGGRVVEVKAERGEELLRKMISMDAGAAMLGECALISEESPINKTGVLFYNTLFDENASCHLALGRGFPDCIADYEKYTQDDYDKMGLNDSMIHVDFMIGAPDLSIIGVTDTGEEIELFRNGTWAF